MDLGMFMMPIHPARRAVSETLAEDVEKVVLADKLGFAEAWIGEHFTATTEPITAPLMFMAACLPQTRQIKFATGVINMPVHHPIILASELAQFDHLSRGRLIFGIGPGALASDWEVFKSADGKEREEKTLESVDLILKIWSQDPPYNLRGKYWDVVIEKNILPELGFGWLSKPYQKPHPMIAMSVMSPFSGSGKTAGLRGWAPISANFIPEYSVASHWQKYLEGCDAAKRKPDGESWRVARNILVAPTDAEAHEIAHAEDGALNFYYSYLWHGLSVSNYTVAIKPDPKMDDKAVTADILIDQLCIYGSPKTVADRLVALREKVGPFGHLILGAPDWEGKNREWEQRSMTLLAEEVMPRFCKSLSLKRAG